MELSRAAFDAIVVGSGMTGGLAAQELTRSGLKVLVLERGRAVDGDAHRGAADLKPWQLPYGGLAPRALYRSQYAVQSTNASFDETTRSLWLNDLENPYDHAPGQPFHWLQANVVGGRSLLWYGQSYRMSEQDFTANRTDGHGIDWPIRYRDLAPWYDYVEQMIGISGNDDGVAALPAGHYLPAMEMNAVEKHAKQRIEAAFPDRKMIIGRTAIRTRGDGERGACVYCRPCQRGCPTGAHFNSLSATLPAARRTGLLTLRADTLVERLVCDDAASRVTGVQAIDTVTNERTVYEARMVFLCASAVASTQILLNSATEAAPRGLGNRSGNLGHYLMDHPTFGGAVGVVPGFEQSYYYGHRPNCVYVPRFRNLDGGDDDVGFLRGYGLQGHAQRMGWRDAYRHIPGFGAEFKAALIRPGPWTIGLRGFGECLPYRDNRITLSRNRTDRFGIPQVEFHFSFRDNERRQGEDIVAQARALLEAAGAVNIVTTPQNSIGGDGIHEMGTACMGNDPRTSVLNAFNQSHDVPNLFVTDGAGMSSASCVNPALTFMALTARAAHYAVAQFRAGVL